MQKQNGFKMFERDFRRQGKLNGKDYAELALLGITKVDSDRYFKNLRFNADISIIPTEAEKDKKQNQKTKYIEKEKERKAA